MCTICAAGSPQSEGLSGELMVETAECQRAGAEPDHDCLRCVGTARRLAAQQCLHQA
jgi:hypothetical protein